MDYESAKRVGDMGERQVAAELERLAPKYGLTILNDVLLRSGKMTAQMDHVVVDRYGVLILESKVRNQAHIKGNHLEPKWTACYGHGRNKPFQNPIRQNDGHANAVFQALQRAGKQIDLDFVKGAVVMVGADISGLQLDSLAKAKVTTLQGLEGLIRLRHDFAVNAGISPEEVGLLAALIRRLDMSGDPEVMMQHRAYRQGDARVPSPGTPARASNLTRTARQACKPSSPAAPTSTYRPVAPTVGGRQVLGLAIIVFVLATTACALGPGLAMLSDFLTPGFRRAATSSQEQPASVPGVSVERAKVVLMEAAPEKYGSVVNIDQPLVTTVPQGTTFTWEYVSNPAANIAEVKTIALTLDAEGNLVGVDIQ